MSKTDKLKAPFPYFGGKSRVAHLVWERLGPVDNYIEPFCGSAAVLLARPDTPRIETVNDADCYLANFWRATQHDPESVAALADYPVNEADLHARHCWLVLSEEAADFRRRMRSDPTYYDVRFAGWWCWGLCCWIGGGWCTAHGETAGGDRKECAPTPLHKGVIGNGKRGPAGGTGDRNVKLGGGPGQQGNGVHAKGELPQKRPRAHRAAGSSCSPCNLPGVLAGDISDGRVKGLREKMPMIGKASGGVGIISDTNRQQLADAYSRGRGVNGNDDAGTCDQRRAWLLDWFGRLRDRLRTVRVCCGDWLRVCDSESVTTRLGVTGVFFDPPYGDDADRDMNLYAVDSGTVAADVRAYCLERGGDPKLRIVLAGYAGEGHEELEAHGWKWLAWQAQGGYGNRSEAGKANAKKERLWFSPHCQQPPSLF